MPTTHTLVIGAGQAGLAMSRCLTDAGIDHVVLERGRTAERWRSERWDSLRLLTPNWASRLPGWSYRGPHPDGYMTAAELAAYLTDYAGSFDAPIEQGTTSASSSRADDGFIVRTSDTSWSARNVVIATGWCDQPRVPGFAERLDPASPSSRRAPTATRTSCPTGGCSSSAPPPPGCRSPTSSPAPAATSCSPSAATAGCPAATAAWTSGGGSTRSARSHGPSTRSATRPRPATRARSSSSAATTTATSTSPRSQRLGVRLTGRLTGIDGDDLTFADDLGDTTAAADERLRRLLARIDDHIDATGLDPRGAPRRHARPAARGRTAHASPRPARRHRAGRVGHRLPPPLPVAARPRPRPRTARSSNGAASPPSTGLYVLGQRFQHRRDSNFIDGVRHDAVLRRPPHRRPRHRHPTAPLLSHEDAP